MTTEIWKKIPGYPEYEASTFGRIRSINRITKRDSHTTRKIAGRILSPARRSIEGYLQVNLSRNGKSKVFLIHRLIALTFISNPNNYPEVNHKDENKANNNVNNLEWCTRKYNMNYNSLPSKRYKKVLKFDDQNHLMCEYKSVKDAAACNNLSKGTISGYCRGNHKDPKNFKWKFKV